MKFSTAAVLVLSSAVGAGLGATLTRRQGTWTKMLAVGTGAVLPWGVHALTTSDEPQEGCTILWISDTHGSAAANADLVGALLSERGVDRVIHSGDVVDSADLWSPWWDRPFAEVMRRWPIDVASGNHDRSDDATYQGFKDRFGGEPHTVRCGNAQFFLVPWGRSGAYARWLLRQVTASDAQWKVLVSHEPLWGADGSGHELRTLYAESLPYIDLVLSGHQHIAWKAEHEVAGRVILQLIDVSGPKKYRCPSVVEGCTENETAYWRIRFDDDAMEAVRRVVA